MELFFLIGVAILALGASVVGLAIGAVVWLLYQWPDELRKFREELEAVLVPLKAALDAAAQAQKEAALRTQQYSNLMRTLDTSAPMEEPKTWRRERKAHEQTPDDWQPDWVSQMDGQARRPE